MISQFIWYNGQVLDSSSLNLDPLNRAFRYGDGVFETIHLHSSKPLFFLQHYRRLIESLEVLQFDLDEQWQPSYFLQPMNQLAHQNGLQNARIRLYAWRDGDGLYRSSSGRAEFLMTMEEKPTGFSQNPDGIEIDVSLESKSGTLPFECVKSLSAQRYVLAGIEAEKRNLDDVLLTGRSDFVCEASSSSIFAFDDQGLISPPEGDGGVPGVMRRVLIKLAKRQGIPFREQSLTAEDLLQKQELFLSNVMGGIQWVRKFRESTYENKVSTGLMAKLEEQIMRT